MSADLLAPTRYLSQSEYRVFKNCRRQWYLTYYRRLGNPPERESVSGVRNLGIAVHLAMEGHYSHDLDPDHVLVAYYEDLIRLYPLYASDLANELAYARIMVAGYLRWAEEDGVDAEYEVVASEGDVSILIEVDASGRQVVLRGRLDQAVRRRGGDEALLFRDFKTVGSLIKGPELKRDEQLRFYSLLQWLLVHDSGDRVDGALYTMMKRSKRTARAVPPFYSTIHVSYNVNDYASMLMRVKRVAVEILDTITELESGVDHRATVYPNPGSACTWCPFVQVCDLADDGSRFEDALEDLYVPIDPMGHYANDRIEHVKGLLAPSVPGTMETPPSTWRNEQLG